MGRKTEVGAVSISFGWGNVFVRQKDSPKLRAFLENARDGRTFFKNKK